VGKIAKKQSEGVRFQKYTPTDCFFVMRDNMYSNIGILSSMIERFYANLKKPFQRISISNKISLFR